MYEAVLFDLFGTLVNAPPMSAYRQMVTEVAAILEQPFESFYDPWMSINDGRLNGSFGSSEGDILAAAKLVGVSVSDEQMARCMDVRRSITRTFLEPKPGVLTMLESLSTTGRALGLVTDCVFDVPAVWPETPFARLFTANHFSCETNVRKPHPRTYLSVLEKLGIEPANALFVGDGGSDELNGANRAGIDALMIDDAEPTDKTLRVGVTDWNGPRVTNIADIPAYISGHSKT